MSDVQLLGRQIGYEQRSYWRNPTAAGFSFLFPVVLLVIIASTGRNNTITSLGPGKVNFTQYYIPAIVAFGVMGACFTNLAISTTFKRDMGILKRMRGTPLPAWAYMGGVIGNSIIVSILLSVLIIGLGIVAYSVTFPGHTAALIVSLVVGAATFCALGLAMTTVIPNADAAPAIVNLVFFPLVTISGTFFPVQKGSTLAKIASIFPLKPFIDATFNAFDRRVQGSGFKWSSLSVMAVWGVAGLLVAARRFRWEPQRK
ncbi:MAG TPA: ABC transporter permease [Acidimicrobiales bacterium]|nr:ABC transporter permease [Acidimicrobiales bacterium]